MFHDPLQDYTASALQEHDRLAIQSEKVKEQRRGLALKQSKSELDIKALVARKLTLDEQRMGLRDRIFDLDIRTHQPDKANIDLEERRAAHVVEKERLGLAPKALIADGDTAQDESAMVASDLPQKRSEPNIKDTSVQHVIIHTPAAKGESINSSMYDLYVPLLQASHRTNCSQ